MSSLIDQATIKHRRDTASNWTSNNPTLSEGEWGYETDTNGIKIGDGATAWTSLGYSIGEIGEKKTFFTYKDRTSRRLLPYAYNNKVSTTGTYSVLYAEIGDIFEKAHTDAGDAASGAGFFYPTPPPWGYARAGMPDIEFSNTDVAANLLTESTPSGFRDGTIARYELLTGTTITNLTDGTEYYLRRASSTTLSIHTTEANAIANTSPIAIASGGTGTFRLTQEGISIDHAVEDHDHLGKYTDDVTAQSGAGVGFSRVLGSATKSLSYSGNVGIADVLNANTSNETRPSTYYEFGYVRY
jgi:hypothetical protein